MWGAIATQGDEGDVFAAQALNTSAADDAFSVSTENDLEQQSRRIGGGACLVIAITRIKTGQVKVVIEQVMDSMGKTAGDELLLSRSTARNRGLRSIVL